jgi:hypothetical protein
VEPVLAAGTLTGYPPLPAAHADLLERSGQDAEAAAAWARAAAAWARAEATAGTTTLQRELRRRRDERGTQDRSEEKCRSGLGRPWEGCPIAHLPGAQMEPTRRGRRGWVRRGSWIVTFVWRR